MSAEKKGFYQWVSLLMEAWDGPPRPPPFPGPSLTQWEKRHHPTQGGSCPVGSLRTVVIFIPLDFTNSFLIPELWCVVPIHLCDRFSDHCDKTSRRRDIALPPNRICTFNGHQRKSLGFPQSCLRADCGFAAF